MPEYWVDDGRAKTQLQIGAMWPETGGEAYAGSLTELKQWVFSPYVSYYWFCANFTQNGGLYTSGLDSCSALVYLFGPQGSESVTHGALWHVNCSAYKAEHAPNAARSAIGVSSLALKHVVIGYNQVSRGVKMTRDVESSIRDFRLFLEKYDVELEPWIYVGNKGMFGVNRDGYVGTPQPMSVDTISPRRNSLEVTLDESADGGLLSDMTPTPFCCSRCYITTAVCRSQRLDDDCDALRTLRRYRDTVLSQTEQGRADIRRYYATAPAVVARIESDPHADAVYARLYEGDILPAIAAIREGRYVQAYAIYRAMFDRVCAQYL